MRPDDPTTDAGRMVEDLLELYAIHALPDDEAQAFERALGALDESSRRRAVAEIRSTRDAVSRWAGEYAENPGPQVRERVLTSVARRESAHAPVDRAVVTDELAARRARRRRMAVAISSAAAALLLVVGGVVIGRSTVSSPADQPQIAQSDQMAAMQNVMSRSDVEVHRTEMTGMPGTVVVASSRSADKAVVVLEGAQQPPSERIYQLWLIGNSHAPKSAGLVSSVAGQSPIVVTGLTGSRTIGMTVEPDGGSAQPTGAVVAAVTF
ncbi:anti-sigma factor [uncultured Williamsia sp.]|uniref:anti-sigma factor n=1 Tax=uncultured Williamsia sp. TaxID=259311 RepID=UPI002615EAB4|nr:anti-sigma factor [uncultured Williamsia sp.]